MRPVSAAVLLGMFMVLANERCFAAGLKDLEASLQADMAQREAWVTHAGFPPNYRVDETAKVLLIDLDAAELPRRDEDAVIDGLLNYAANDVQKAAIKIVCGQIAHDR